MPTSTYAEAVRILQSLPDMERGHLAGTVPSMSLSTMKSLLDLLNNPQRGRNTIHVTGSKGKGSTCTMIASILKEAELHTALFTSPHLHSYCERIAFDLQPVSEDDFAETTNYLHHFLNDQKFVEPLSTFGLLTAIFFLLARDAKPSVDWQIVEVGLGGKDDATNVFDSKEVAVIAPISLEHTKILGASYREIAGNKAGIITPGTTVVLAPQSHPEVVDIIEEACVECGARLIDVQRRYAGKQVAMDLKQQSFLVEYLVGHRRRFTAKSGYVDMGDGLFKLELSMPGLHQMVNAVTAVAVAEALVDLGHRISRQNIVDGIRKAWLAGRFEIVNGGTGDKPIFVLDGAHNPESASAVASTLSQLFKNKQIIFVVGINKDKDIAGFVGKFAPFCKHLIATRSQNARSADPEFIRETMQHMGLDVASSAANSVSEAMEEALTLASSDDVVCVTGSLYTVAEAREYLKLSLRELLQARTFTRHETQDLLSSY